MGTQSGRQYAPEAPRFTTAERDRRWGHVRQLMEQAGLDALVVPRQSGNWDVGNANARYLTCIGGNCSGAAVVFPRAGEVTAIVGPVPAREYWLELQDWVSDVRYAGRNTRLTEGAAGASGHTYGGGIVERLRELHVARGRIGVAGLDGTTRSPEGIVPHGAYVKLREAFPEAEIVDATAVLDAARVVKGPEELEWLERSAALVDRAFDTLLSEARPGVPEAAVYVRMIARMVEDGGELPHMLLWSAGWPQRQRNYMMPSQKPLVRGDLIACEIDGNYGGYRAQLSAMAVLGAVAPGYAAMLAAQQAVLRAVYAALRPGTRMGDLMALCAEEVNGTAYTCRLIMHGRGLGDDAPMIIVGTRDPKVLDYRLEQNSVFVIKPLLWEGHADQWERWVCWGDSVVVTPDGPRHLSRHTPAIAAIG
jgi:Xaa-Pro aminopeptidase